MAALFMNAQEAVSIWTCLEALGHPQPATKLKTNNSKATGILNGTIKQKRSKAIDMHYCWLKEDHQQHSQFNIYWEAEKRNLADYPTKHHPLAHRKCIRPIYIYDGDSSPKTVQAGIKILTADRQA